MIPPEALRDLLGLEQWALASVVLWLGIPVVAAVDREHVESVAWLWVGGWLSAGVYGWLSR